MTFATGADVADNRMPNGQTPNRHHPDLAACKTWPGGEPLTQADKSKLMDVIQTAGQHGVGPALHGGLKVMMDRGKADGWQARSRQCSKSLKIRMRHSQPASARPVPAHQHDPAVCQHHAGLS
jgi:hypothetical protein